MAVESSHSAALQLEAKRKMAMSSYGMSSHLDLDLLGYPSLIDAPFIPKAQFIFVRAVGQGSFGRVYKGILYDQDVAIKQLTVKNFVDQLGESATGLGSCDLDSDGVSEAQALKSDEFGDVLLALEREVAILRNLRHQKIVMFLGVCLEPPCIITEYCQQGSLYDLLSRARERPEVAKKLTWKMRIKIACDAASGMNYLHSSNPAVLHRDLKSPNLLVDEHWNCKVADFNTSRFIDPSCVTSSISANNPRWLAPEVLSGEVHTMASDVYPFGLVMWELLTWKTPWEAEAHYSIQIVNLVARGLRPRLPDNLADLPGDSCPFLEQYTELMEECWDTNPSSRPNYSSIVARLADLRKSLEKKPQKVSPKVKAHSPPVSPRLNSKIPSPFQSGHSISQYDPKSQPSEKLEMSPFSGGPPGPPPGPPSKKPENAQENTPPKKPTEEFTVTKRALPEDMVPSNPSSQASSRTPYCPPSFGVWSHAGSTQTSQLLPTKAKEHWENLKALFLNASKSEGGVISEKWDVLQKLMVGSMVPELPVVMAGMPQPPSKPQLADKSNQPFGFERKDSKWGLVRDVFTSGSMDKKEENEHPGWKLIKSILLPEDDNRPKNESPKEPESNAENLAEAENETGEKASRSKWEVLKHLLFDEQVPRSPGWDLLHQILISTSSSDISKPVSFHTQSSEPEKNTASEVCSKPPVSAAKKRWKSLQDLFCSNTSAEKPVEEMHPGWQLVKELLGDDLVSGSNLSTMLEEPAAPSSPEVSSTRSLKRVPSKAERYWYFLRHMLVKDEGSLLVKHWDFLKDTFGEMKDEESEKNANSRGGVLEKRKLSLKSPASKRWKKVRDLLIVDYNPPSTEKWNFLREWLTVDGDLGDSWDELRAFARSRVGVPQGGDWDLFRTLFFEDRGVRDHPHWAFLKDLLVKDAVPATVMAEPDGAPRAAPVEPEKVVEFVLEKASTPPSKSRWSMVRTLFLSQDSSPSHVRDVVMDTVGTPEKSKWDEIITLLKSDSSTF